MTEQSKQDLAEVDGEIVKVCSDSSPSLFLLCVTLSSSHRDCTSSMGADSLVQGQRVGKGEGDFLPFLHCHVPTIVFEVTCPGLYQTHSKLLTCSCFFNPHKFFHFVILEQGSI